MTPIASTFLGEAKVNHEPQRDIPHKAEVRLKIVGFFGSIMDSLGEQDQRCHFALANIRMQVSHGKKRSNGMPKVTQQQVDDAVKAVATKSGVSEKDARKVVEALGLAQAVDWIEKNGTTLDKIVIGVQSGDMTFST